MTRSVRDTVAELTAALVAIPSHGGRERAAQELVGEWLTGAGFRCEMQPVAVGRFNLIATRGAGGPFLCSHADTQPPFAHPDPYTARRDAGRLVGRGALDAKGQIAALVHAAQATTEPAVVVITCDEEVGGSGSERLQLPPGVDLAAGGVVLEPTALVPCVAQAGNVEVRVDVAGQPVHMAEPERGLSALDVVQQAIGALASCSFLGATHPRLPPPWHHIGRLRSGEHLWRTPGVAAAELSLAVLPGVDVEAARSEVEGVLSGLAASLPPGTLRFELPDANPAIEVPGNLPAVVRLQEALGGGVQLGGMRSWTDAANLLLEHGLPCAVFGAGDLAPAHSDYEWVELDDLVGLAEVLARLIVQWPPR